MDGGWMSEGQTAGGEREREHMMMRQRGLTFKRKPPLAVEVEILKYSIYNRVIIHV